MSYKRIKIDNTYQIVHYFYENGQMCSETYCRVDNEIYWHRDPEDGPAIRGRLCAVRLPPDKAEEARERLTTAQLPRGHHLLLALRQAAARRNRSEDH